MTVGSFIFTQTLNQIPSCMSLHAPPHTHTHTHTHTCGAGTTTVTTAAAAAEQAGVRISSGIGRQSPAQAVATKATIAMWSRLRAPWAPSAARVAL